MNFQQEFMNYFQNQMDYSPKNKKKPDETLNPSFYGSSTYKTHTDRIIESILKFEEQFANKQNIEKLNDKTLNDNTIDIIQKSKWTEASYIQHDPSIKLDNNTLFDQTNTRNSEYSPIKVINIEKKPKTISNTASNQNNSGKIANSDKKKQSKTPTKRTLSPSKTETRISNLEKRLAKITPSSNLNLSPMISKANPQIDIRKNVPNAKSFSGIQPFISKKNEENAKLEDKDTDFKKKGKHAPGLRSFGKVGTNVLKLYAKKLSKTINSILQKRNKELLSSAFEMLKLPYIQYINEIKAIHTKKQLKKIFTALINFCKIHAQEAILMDKIDQNSHEKSKAFYTLKLKAKVLEGLFKTKKTKTNKKASSITKNSMYKSDAKPAKNGLGTKVNASSPHIKAKYANKHATELDSLSINYYSGRHYSIPNFKYSQGEFLDFQDQVLTNIPIPSPLETLENLTPELIKANTNFKIIRSKTPNNKKLIEDKKSKDISNKSNEKNLTGQLNLKHEKRQQNSLTSQFELRSKTPKYTNSKKQDKTESLDPSTKLINKYSIDKEKLSQVERFAKRSKMKWFGWIPWKRYINRQQNLLALAEAHWKKKTLTYCLELLSKGSVDSKNEIEENEGFKVVLAEEKYNKTLKFKAFNSLIEYYVISNEENQAYENHRSSFLVRSCFRLWFEIIPQLKAKNIEIEKNYTEMLNRFIFITKAEKILSKWKEIVQKEKKLKLSESNKKKIIPKGNKIPNKIIG